MHQPFTEQDCKILGRETLYQGFFRLESVIFQHKLFAGGWSEPVTRELLLRGNAVGVLLFDSVKECFVLVEQVRIGAQCKAQSPWLLELVAGMVESGETADEVAIRESAEEAGAQVSELYSLGSYWSSPGGTDEKIDLFIADVDSDAVSETGGLADEHEDILVRIIPVDEVRSMLDSKLLNNAMILIAVQHFFLNEDKIRTFFTKR